MKILSIRLKNLASLSGEHFIDFESEPLASAGLVAIVGKTGAGKSTILDAMCLALFNKIPRLKDSDGKLQDVDGSELLTNSPLTVLRRGTAHGFAELCFVAQDQKHYLARWELKRSREKADGKLQSVQRYLKCLTDATVIADKAKAVDSSIYKITQLSFEQFTRAVLLAQSEVTAFLKARDNERGELLEYLTNSAIFGKIGQLAYEKTKLVASKRKELENLLGHIDLLSDEDLAELSAQFQHIESTYQTLEAEKTRLEKQWLWFERKQKLEHEMILKQQFVDVQLKAQHDLMPERKRLNRLEEFSEIRPIVVQQQQFFKNQQQLTPQLQKQQQLFDELNVQFEQQKQNFTQVEATLNDIQNFETTHFEALKEVRKCIQERDFIGTEFKKIQSKLNQLEQSQHPLQSQQQDVAQHIQQLTQQQIHLSQKLVETEQFSSLDKGLTAHLQQLSQFIQHYPSIENQLGNLNQAEAKLTEQSTQLQALIDQFGKIDQLETLLEQTRQQREITLYQLNQFDVLQQKLQQFFELQSESQQLTAQIHQRDTQCQQLEKATVQAEQDYHTAKEARIKLQDILQQQRLLHAENIENLRAALTVDQPCVVCGSTTHPYKMGDSVVSKALFDLQLQQEQKATLQEQDMLKIWQLNQQHLTKLNAEQQQQQTLLKRLVERITATQQTCTEQIDALKIKLDLTQTQSEIMLQLRQLTEQFQQQIKQMDLQSKQWMQTIKMQQQLMQSTQHAVNLLQQAKSLQQQIQHIVLCLPEKEQDMWQLQTITTAENVCIRLKQRAQQLDQQEQYGKQLDLYTQQQLNIQLNLDNIFKHITETSQSLAEIKLQGLQNTQTANQLIYRMTGLSEVKPNEWLLQHDLQRQQCQQHYQQLKQSFEHLRNQFEQEKSQLEQLKVQCTQNLNHLNQVNLEIQQWLTQHPDFQSDDLEKLAQITPLQEQQIRQQLQQAERTLNEANSALKTIQEQLTEHETLQPQIESGQLQQLLLDNIDALKIQVEIRDQLKLKLELHQQNLIKQKQFADQIQSVQQEEHRWGKISGLMGDATGKKFRDYAQQYNLDILLEHANQQLAMLSQRYTLKRLENSLSLAIIDHDMDGETRSVASLSGGESFLTALALSLAIANMASGSMKIESLFIDEGFGTLDASSLHMVMNALDQLQNQGRKVVLISHIQDMHERIPVQIQVKPLGAGASTIEVVS
ncbi:AAA family ATPase [Acinetobacter nematophilus]|uniref:AAA family ATPase n=1 Tax=Acinetobacter nematophilus TaxID=2994642 RepID=A0A9X3DX48_9GAMM|nr:AAA family ATPase [Acinetobacter nematophilus]